MALAIAAGAVGAAPSASAQATDEIPEHSGEVTIAARHATALQGIENLEFTVTREVAADYDLEVPVTLSPGIIDPERLSRTVTIEANRASASLSVGTGTLHPGAATGDVTASVGGGDAHDVGDPSTASVRLHIGQTLVTVGLNAGAYEVPESVGETTDEVLVVARTQPGIPAPHSAIFLFLTGLGGTAHPRDDFGGISRPHIVPGESQADWVADGDAWVLETRVPVRIVGDDVDEENETVVLRLSRFPGEAPTVTVARADSTAPPCGASSCSAVLTIVDDDTRGVTVRPSGPLRVQEGENAVYSVVLNSRPTSEVTITPVVRDAAGANISVDQVLTFEPRSWRDVQRVAVQARDDGNVLNGSATVAHTVAGGDYGANGVTAASVPVVEEDSAEHSGEVTIAARHATALQGIENLEFTVTREVAADYDLEVPVTLSPGIIDPERLSRTVTIEANRASASLSVGTGTLHPGAATGDVTASVGGGDAHDVGDPSTASVRLHIGQTLVTVGLNAGAYEVPESVGETTDEVLVVARTQPGIPAPHSAIFLFLTGLGGTAHPRDDFGGISRPHIVPGESQADWVADGDAWVLETRVPVRIVGDDVDEENETVVLRLSRFPGEAPTVTVARADSTAPPCGASSCSAVLTIVDDDTRGVTVRPSGPLRVQEGENAVYSVVLNSRPTSEVTITPVVRDAAGANISVDQVLTFEPRSWRDVQRVAVQARDDGNVLNGSATVAHTVAGGDYGANGVTAASVPVVEEDSAAASEPPAKPTGLSADIVSHDTVTLTWDNPGDENITGYAILRRDNAIHPENTLQTIQADTATAATTYTDNTAQPSREYMYHIRAINAAGNGDISNSVRAHTVAAPPAGLVSEVSHNSVTLRWDNPGDDTITGYVILRRDKAIHPEGTFETIQAATATARTTYPDNTVQPSREYVYRIRAINAAGTSEISDWVRADTVAAPPAGLVSEVSHNSVTLRWDNPGDDTITGYAILRRDNAIHPENTLQTIQADTATAATAYTDNTAQPSREYMYYIRAINAHGNSDISNSVRAYTPAAP